MTSLDARKDILKAGRRSSTSVSGWSLLGDLALYNHLVSAPSVKFLFVFLPIGALALFHLGPMLRLAQVGMLESYPLPPGQAASYTAAHYLRLFEDPLFWQPLIRTFALAAWTSLLTLVVALPVAWLLIRHIPAKSRYRRIFLLLLPFWAGELVRSFALVLVAARKGAVNEGLQWLGVIEAPLDILYTPFALSAGMFYFLILYQILPLYAAIEKLPVSVSEAAADLGAGPWARFRLVTLPLLRPAIASGTTLVFLMALGAYSVPLLLGGTDTVMFSQTIATAFNSGRDTWPIGAALSVLLLIFALTAAGLWLRLISAPAAERRA